MNDFFRNRRIVLLVIVTIILLLIMAFFTVGRAKVSVVEDLIGAITTPVQKLFTSVSQGITGFFGNFKDKRDLESKNKELQEQVYQLENQLRAVDGYKAENERLRDMIDLKNDMREFEATAAQVIAKGPGNWYNTFTIDKGTSSGLQVNHAVITSRGLVGFISEIGTNWAKVTAITDTNSSVGAIIVRTGDITVVDGDMTLGNDGYCRMLYLGKNAGATVGDLVETSGLGGIYPKGILIGKIIEIKADVYSLSQYAVIEPAVNFDRIDEVFVVSGVNR